MARSRLQASGSPVTPRPEPARTLRGPDDPVPTSPENPGRAGLPPVLCRCQRALIPCPEGESCAKQTGTPLRGWVHRDTMGHECPGSGRQGSSGIVLGYQYSQPVTM